MEQKPIRKILKVDGMTCASCETRIEKALTKLDGIIEAKAQFANSNVTITYDSQRVEMAQIKKAIEKADYTLVEENQPSLNPKDQKKLIGIGIILLAGYLIIQKTVGFNVIPELSANMGYGLLFAIGLLTSLHCIAMCGGINLSQCVTYSYKEAEPSKLAKLKPSFLYNSGRVVAYTLIGGIVGGLGQLVSFSGPAKGLIAILSGAFMIIMGLNMLNVFPWLRKLNPRMPKFLGAKLNKNSSEYGPFYVGLINGFMPCGPLQAMQLYALGTGSFVVGALSMFFFSLGTVPLMFGFGALSTYIGRKLTHDLMKISAILVIVLGVVLAGRGFNLSGINLSSFAMGSGSSNEKVVATQEEGLQLVTTTLASGRYEPIVVKKGIPVRWNIQVAEGDLNGCNRSLIIPTYNIEKDLVVGDNFIEFTPTDDGKFTYTCWMGMIKSTITVLSDTGEIEADPKDDLLLDLSSSASGSCCEDGAKATKFADGNIPTDDITVAKVENNQQIVTVTVNDEGYSPAVLVVQKGVDLKIIFNTEELNSCNNVVNFPEYGGQLDHQKEDQRETPFLTVEKDFTFQCWMGMLNGYVKVVDDINEFDIEAIKTEVTQYVPTSGGGCCGS